MKVDPLFRRWTLISFFGGGGGGGGGGVTEFLLYGAGGGGGIEDPCPCPSRTPKPCDH